MLEQGKLPHIQKLMDEGSWAVLRSTEPMHSPALWTTIATGKSADQHGVHDFFSGTRRYTSKDRKVQAIWNILSAVGRRVLIVGYLNTWPAEPVRGVEITDRLLENGLCLDHSPRCENTVYPPDALKDYPYPVPSWNPDAVAGLDRLRRFVSIPLDPDYEAFAKSSKEYIYNALVSRRLSWVYMRDETLTRVAEHVLAKEEPDFFAIHLWGIDYVSHGFWKYAYPEGRNVSEADRKALGGIIANYYVYADELVGRLTRFAGPDTRILVVSDHGFQAWEPPPGDAHPLLSGNHDLSGIAILSGPGLRKHTELPPGSIFDVMPTMLYLLGLPIASDMAGNVWTQALLPEYQKERIKRIATYDPKPRSIPPGPDVSMTDNEIQYLRSLGYLK